MRRMSVAIAATALACGAAHGVVVNVDQSSAPWLGFMNVFDLGGGFVFNSGWGVGDLNASFNDGAQSLTLSPNTIGDPDPFWYTPLGGPGSAGNKIMEANLYQQVDDIYAGQTVTFQGNVLSNSFTSAHVARIFIRDFAPDFSTVNETIVPLVPGPFSISLNADPGANRHIQWGFQVRGVNVWFTDTAPFGNAVIQTIPGPGGIGLLAMGGLIAARRRRA
jgi:hypothetical protein